MAECSDDRKVASQDSSASLDVLLDEHPDSAHRSGSRLILATRDFAKDQKGRSWWYVLSTASLWIGSLAASLTLPYLPLRILASVLTGLLTLRLFVIYHDHQHRTILVGSRVAEVLMRVFGIWVMSPSVVWRSSHDYHHKHNSKLRGSHIGSFPIMTAEAFREADASTRFWYLFQRHPLTILFGYVFIFLFGMCVRPWMQNPVKHWECLVAPLLHVGVGVLLVMFGGWEALLLGQTLPSLLAYAMGSYLFYVQHNFPGVAFRDNAHWTYEAAALESSSYLRSSRLMAWFTANIGYHHIHHLNPKIPFYRLPEVMRAIPELQSPKSTTLSPLAIYRSFRLKVWNATEQRMTGVTS